MPLLRQIQDQARAHLNIFGPSCSSLKNLICELLDLSHRNRRIYFSSNNFPHRASSSQVKISPSPGIRPVQPLGLLRLYLHKTQYLSCLGKCKQCNENYFTSCLRRTGCTPIHYSKEIKPVGAPRIIDSHARKHFSLPLGHS